jgi:hypothetical protein
MGYFCAENSLSFAWIGGLHILRQFLSEKLGESFSHLVSAVVTMPQNISCGGQKRLRRVAVDALHPSFFFVIARNVVTFLRAN